MDRSLIYLENLTSEKTSAACPSVSSVRSQFTRKFVSDHAWGRVFCLAIWVQLLFLAPQVSLGQDRVSDITINNNLQRMFKASSKLSFTAGAGATVMNSDFVADTRTVKTFFKSNGYGSTLGIGALQQLSPYLAVMVNLDYFSIRGHQTLTIEQRDLYFKSNLITATGSFVLHVSSKRNLNNYYNRSYTGGIVMVPYVRAGLGLLGYDVTSSRNAPEGTPEKEYPALGAVAPLGGGIRFKFSDQMSFATEMVLYMPSSDFLDNLEGLNSYLGSNDKYGSVTIKAIYTPSKRKTL